MTDKDRNLLITVRGIPRAAVGGDFLCGGCRFGHATEEPMYSGRCVLFAIMRAANTQGDYIRCSQCMNAEVAAYARDGATGRNAIARNRKET